MSVDLLFLAQNRLALTRESLAALRRNTNFELVREFVLQDDGSTDGTREYLEDNARECGATFRGTACGTPVDAMSDFIGQAQAEYVAKCDNDAMFPPGWLDIAINVMERYPELGILMLEPSCALGSAPYRYEPSGTTDGLFVARRHIFEGRMLPFGFLKYHGLQWWVDKFGVRCGWLKPALPVFLLDRLPMDPWASLSSEYEARGWQRPWKRYTPEQSELWSWWNASTPNQSALRRPEAEYK